MARQTFSCSQNGLMLKFKAENILHTMGSTHQLKICAYYFAATLDKSVLQGGLPGDYIIRYDIFAPWL